MGDYRVELLVDEEQYTTTDLGEIWESIVREQRIDFSLPRTATLKYDELGKEKKFISLYADFNNQAVAEKIYEDVKINLDLYSGYVLYRPVEVNVFKKYL